MKKRRANRKSQYVRKTRSDFKQGYLDSCSPLNPSVMGKLSLTDTYVDVYTGLKPWERLGTMGYYSVPEHMCTLDRMRIEEGLERLKKTSKDRTITPSETTGEFLTKDVMKLKKKSLRKKKKRKRSQLPKKDFVSDDVLSIIENEFLNRFHVKSKGITHGEHAPIPHGTSTKLREFQMQNLIGIDSHNKFESFTFKLRKYWETQWIGKTVPMFLYIQNYSTGLSLHGISIQYNSLEKNSAGEYSLIVNMSMSFKLDTHGRYYGKIEFECSAPSDMVRNVIKAYSDGKEKCVTFSRYVSKYGMTEQLREISNLFSNCNFLDKLPVHSYFTCICDFKNE